jgi:hypothetical protein
VIYIDQFEYGYAKAVNALQQMEDMYRRLGDKSPYSPEDIAEAWRLLEKYRTLYDFLKEANKGA